MLQTKWCGKMDVPQNHSFLLTNSTFTLAIEHKDREWCIHVEKERALESDDADNQFECHIGEFTPINCGKVSRHITYDETNTLEIKQSLADRTVVCRPKHPIAIVPGASVTIYLSSPIWLSIGVNSNKYTLLKEVETQKLSDTWFGASTRHGELCYASQTNARLNLDNIPYRELRAITPLLIENRASTDLIFERVALPVPSLSLYSSPTGQLWTQNITLIREGDGDFAQVKLGQPQPNTTLVSGPRVELRHGQLIRAFSAIFN
jgi:hypothetical protein